MAKKRFLYFRHVFSLLIFAHQPWWHPGCVILPNEMIDNTLFGKLFNIWSTKYKMSDFPIGTSPKGESRKVSTAVGENSKWKWSTRMPKVAVVVGSYIWQRGPSELWKWVMPSVSPHMVPIHCYYGSWPTSPETTRDGPAWVGPHMSQHGTTGLGTGQVDPPAVESTVSPGKSRFLRRWSIYHKPQPGCSVLKSRKHGIFQWQSISKRL